jgi:hypothetical protein
MSDAVTPTKHASVFISYAKQDEAIADFIQSALNRAGYRASTFTTSVTAGDRWISSINLSLETADVVVALISKAALESHWVLYEISASIVAVEKSSRKRIIPVALSKDLVPAGVLSQYQWVTTSGEPQEVVDAVIQALNEPPITDKALERTEALLNLERVQKHLNIAEERWEERIGRRNAQATRFLIPILSFIILAVAILVVVVYKPSSGVTTAISGVLTAFSAGLAYISGRISTRDERGTSDGRPRN